MHEETGQFEYEEDPLDLDKENFQLGFSAINDRTQQYIDDPRFVKWV